MERCSSWTESSCAASAAGAATAARTTRAASFMVPPPREGDGCRVHGESSAEAVRRASSRQRHSLGASGLPAGYSTTNGFDREADQERDVRLAGERGGHEADRNGDIPIAHTAADDAGHGDP